MSDGFVARYWWTLPATIVGILLVLIFRPELRSLFGTGPAAPASAPAVSVLPSAAPAPPSVTGSTSAAPAPPPAPPAVSAAPSASARPTSVDGKDVDAWRALLRGAVARGDAKVAAQALEAIATIDPARFLEPKLLGDTVTAAHIAAATNDELLGTVFALLSGGQLGEAGPDILYRVTSIHGGSRASKEASDLLAKPEVMAQASPALRIAMEIRDAPCNARMALFDRAAKEGDERTLYLLAAMRASGCGQSGCCMRNEPQLDAAIGALRERIARGK